MYQLLGYKIGRKIYEDEKIVVYEGKKLNDDTPVKIKQLNFYEPDLSNLIRIKHEFELNQMIKSKYIVKIYELKEFDSIPVLIMEDYNPQTLKQFIKNKNVSIMDFLKIAIEIVTALSDIHKANIIHKAICPDNILIDDTGTLIKISNLSAASLVGKGDRPIDNFHITDENIAYISPEQTGRMNRSLDFRTDFYSLGVTLYEFLTGFVPFTAEDNSGLIYCHLAKEPIAPCDVKKYIPKTISDIIMKLMEKMAEARYQSATGILKDLEKCLKELYDNNQISPFKLGKEDIYDKFIIPQKLYGRDEEINLLLESFEKVSKGSKEIVSVSGYSGVGKSTLVHEIKKNVIKKHGFFVKCKFDQLNNHNMSYSAFEQIFEEIIHQILSGSKGEISIWKNKIMESLGPNSKIIIDILPSLELILGNQPEVPPLPPNEAVNRFNFVFRNFINCFCSEDHPLVVFLDDMQWCDLITLKLLKNVVEDKEILYLYIIISFRYNEVYDEHPLMLTMDSLIKSGNNVNNIILTPLQLKEVNLLLSETLHCSMEKTESFAELCLNKTEGNPFFLNQFLQFLFEKKLIWFDINGKLWKWDLESIKFSNITDNVAEILSQRIKNLSFEAQELLTLAACVGNVFNLNLLANIRKENIEVTYNLLNETVLEGLIITDEKVIDKSFNINYHFSHDKIQQTAYELIDADYKKKIHLEIGRLLLFSLINNNLEDNIFDIVNHHNFAIELINDPYEKELLAKLELRAGKRAKKSTNYELAFQYFQTGIALLQTNCWEKQYYLSLYLFSEAAEAAYLSDEIDVMFKYKKVIDKNTKTILDRMPINKIVIQCYISQGNISKAINTFLKIVRQLGLNIDKNPSKAEVMFRLMKTKHSLKNKRVDDLKNLPLMNDAFKSSIISLFSIIGPIYYMTDSALFTLLVTEAIDIFLKYGNTSDAPFLYGGYGLVLCSTGDIENGYKFGKLAYDLMEKLNHKNQKAGILFINNSFIFNWKEHLNNLIPFFKEGYEYGLNLGDHVFAAYNAFNFCTKSFFAGKNLEELEKEVDTYVETIKKLKQELPLYLTLIIKQLINNLRVKNANPVSFKSELYNEDIMIPFHLESKDSTALSLIYISKLILSYIFEDHNNGEINRILAEKTIENIKSTFEFTAYYFYSSLNIIANYPNISKIKQISSIKQVSINQAKMQKWSKHAPMNFLHKYYLVEAEMARIFNKDLKALEFYNLAIEGARKNNYIQDEALANELMAKFYISRNNKKLAKFYMEEARYCYLVWGASAKVSHLQETYGSIFYSHFERAKINASSSLNKNSSLILDNTTLLKATQAISSEIRLEELFKKLVYLLLENSGAQRVVVLTKQKWYFTVVAEGSSEKNYINLLNNIDLESYKDLPEKVINFVIYSKKIKIIDSADSNEEFMEDPYFQLNKPKSILCMPIINKMKITAIIYMENNLIEGAFSKERLEILKVISSQLAVSMENALMYQDLEILNNNLEQKLKERTTELNEVLNKVYFLLDNSGEGFLIFNKDYIIDSEYSKECNVIFSKDIDGLNVLNLLFGENIELINSFTKTLSIILYSKDLFQRDVLISLLPSVLNINSKYIKVKYKILENSKVMLILSDVTHEKELEERIKLEQLRFKFIVSSITNKNDFIDLTSSFRVFINKEIDIIISSSQPKEKKLSEIYRAVHTFKGAFSQIGFINIPCKLHEIESELTKISKTDYDYTNEITELFANGQCIYAFEKDIEIITDTLGLNFISEKNHFYIDDEQLLKLEQASEIMENINKDLENPLITESTFIINKLRFKNIKEMMKSFPEYTLSIAEKLEKNIQPFEIEGNDVLIDPEKYSSFIKSLVHIFRNAADHGIETPEERVQKGKEFYGRISCNILKSESYVTISIEDDGKGVDFEKIKKKALDKNIIKESSLSNLTEEDLLKLLFYDDFSTKDTVNDFSGRGYGLSSVIFELEKIKGSCKIETVLGKGTKFYFEFQIEEVF